MVFHKGESSFLCKDESGTSEKLNKFIKSGSKSMQIIIDFDFTMTSYEPAGTCFGVIRAYPGFGKEFLEKAEAIKNHHLPIHVDFSLPEAVRQASDLEWMKKTISSFAGERFSRSLLTEMLHRSQCRLRSGVVEFLELAHTHEIPVLIFSGGIWDVIEVLLKEENCYFPNIQILANRLKYDSDGIMVGVEDPMITASSKLAVAQKSSYFSEVQRDNIFLLGDMLSDLKMAGCAKHSELLSIGFANNAKDEESYQEHFDAVLGGNPGFDEINEILKKIVAE